MARGRKDYEKAVVAVETEGFVNPHGRILMYDDFEDVPLKWNTAGTGIWTVSRQARAAYNRSFGLEMGVTSAMPPDLDSAGVSRYIPLDITERLLLELFWRANDLTRLAYLDIQVKYFDGANYHNALLQYDRVAGIWNYRNKDNIMVAVPGGAQTFYNNAWNELTLSADFSINEYITFKSNNIEINMGGVECRSVLNGVAAHTVIELIAYNNTADQLLTSIDDIIIRELET